MRTFKFKLPFFKTKSPRKTEEKNEEMDSIVNKTFGLSLPGSNDDAAGSANNDNNQNPEGFDTYLNVRPWG